MGRFPIDDDELLEALNEERQKFTRSDEVLIGRMVEELIMRGVYPVKAQEGNPNTIRAMVDGWGAYWHLWREPLECPHCKTDLRDTRVGPPFKREIGVELGRDCVDHYECPDCRKNIARK